MLKLKFQHRIEMIRNCKAINVEFLRLRKYPESSLLSAGMLTFNKEFDSSNVCIKIQIKWF